MKEKIKKEQRDRKTKQAKGITLIALVITIIVLLILAGVSIAMLTGENGILSQAQNASKQTEIAEEKEQIALAYNGAVTKKQSTDVTADDLNDQFKANGVNNATASGENPITVTFTEEDGTTRTYTIDANGKISEAGSGQTPGGGETTESVQPGEKVETTEKDNYTDAEGNKATVPEGFVVSKIPEEQNISTGLVIYDIPENELGSVDWEAKNEDGAYNVQTKYNQFVWIPVAEGEYERDFSYPSYYSTKLENTPEGSTFTDTGYLPEGITVTTNDAEGNETAEREAVMKYNGFYIGRYEAGVDGTTVISKQNATVYINKKQTEFKEIAKTMYTGNNVKSAMSSGIQWDMVMKFVDGKNDGKGNPYNVRAYDANRHSGIGVTASGKNEYDKVQNIYDLEGNCFEYVAEKNSTGSPFVSRGGYYNKKSYYRASGRISNGDYATSNNTFRPALYIM